MKNNRGKSPVAANALSPHPEIDYAPKKYTLGQQILALLKFTAVFVIIFFMLWLFEK